MIIQTKRKSTKCILIYTQNKIGNLEIDLPFQNLDLLDLSTLINTFDLKNKNIKINTKGGGFMSKLFAIRLALAKLIIKLKDTNKKLILELDQKILNNYTKKKLPKKYGGSGARAKRQKSYR